MTYDTAREWEREAERIGEMMVRKSGGAWKLEKCGCKNVKPLYNPRWMFEPRDEGVKRVFVGIHPAGDPYNPLADNPNGDMLEYLDDCPSDRPHNQWIDGDWGGKGPDHQDKVEEVFKSLYGDDGWKRELRATPSFNVCPLRSKGAADLPKEVWDDSVEWFLRVLVHLRPMTIICNSSADSGRSPWVEIKTRFGIESVERRPKIGTASLKWGTVSGLSAGGTLVIGVNQRSSNAVYGYLSELSAKLDIA